MTQDEKFLQRLKTLDASSLYMIIVYVKADGSLGFWAIEKKSKIEGEQKEVFMLPRESANVV